MAYSGSVASRGTIPEVLKPIFDKQLRDIIPNEYKFWQYVKEADGEKVKLHGDYFEIEVQATRNDRSEAGQELGDLPYSGVPTFKKGTIKPVRVFAPLQIGHEMAKIADSDIATYATKLEALYDDARTAFVKNLNRQSVGDGTGVVATVGAATVAAASVQVTVDDTKFFEEGTLFDIWRANATVNTQPKYVQVSSVDSATLVTVVMNDATNVPVLAIGDLFIRKNSAYIDGGVRASLEMNGLQAITKSATGFMGIPWTVRRWRPTLVDAAAGVIGPKLMAKAEIVKRRSSASQGKLTTVFCSPEQTVEMIYGTNGTTDKIRYTREDAAKLSVKKQNNPTFNFDGRDIQVQTDLDLPTKKAFIFNDEALLVGQLHDVEFEEFDGRSSLPVFNPTTGSYVAADIMWLGWRGNLGCFARNEFVEVYNLAAPS
jgi:hypothetical protein